MRLAVPLVVMCLLGNGPVEPGDCHLATPATASLLNLGPSSLATVRHHTGHSFISKRVHTAYHYLIGKYRYDHASQKYILVVQ